MPVRSVSPYTSDCVELANYHYGRHRDVTYLDAHIRHGTYHELDIVQRLCERLYTKVTPTCKRLKRKERNPTKKALKALERITAEQWKYLTPQHPSPPNPRFPKMHREGTPLARNNENSAKFVEQVKNIDFEQKDKIISLGVVNLHIHQCRYQ